MGSIFGTALIIIFVGGVTLSAGYHLSIKAMRYVCYLSSRQVPPMVRQQWFDPLCKLNLHVHQVDFDLVKFWWWDALHQKHRFADLSAQEWRNRVHDNRMFLVTENPQA